MKWRLLLWIVLVAVLIGNSTLASAHALQPGYLELSLGGEQQYDVVWKVPMVRGQPMAIAAVLPENCDPRKATAPIWDGVAYIARWTTRCNGGLEGGLVEIDGLGRTTTDVLVRFEFANGVSESRRLTAESPSFTIPGQPSRLEVVQTYLSLGLDHILTGVDHLLFVLALLLLLQDLRSLIITITAFTIAHSLTLAGATLGWVQVPGPPVEAVIALSIVFVASRIVGHSAEKPDLMARYPWSIAFTFGLLHGFGFAGALAEIGLPQDSIPMALLFFNLGIELGQLLFVLFCVGLFAIVRTITRGRDQFPSVITDTAMATASAVARTSWARMILAPRSIASTANATLAARRSSTSLFSTLAIIDFLETPTNIGNSSFFNAANRFIKIRLCCSVLPKPNPGSTSNLSRSKPIALQRSIRARRKSSTSSTTS